MITVHVGSENRSKLVSVENAFRHYFDNVTVKGVPVESGVGSQPVSLEEIAKGAKNRALNAFQASDYSVGMEAGVFEMPDGNSKYFDLCLTCIYDGKRMAWGGSPIYEYPPKVVKRILDYGEEVGDIGPRMYGLKQDMRHHSGFSGFLTQGVIPRTKFNEYSVVMALAHFVNKDL